MNKEIPMADFSITQNIPVANHVYKFLVARYGTDHITASRKTFVGNLILSLHGRNMDVDRKKIGFTKIFRITVSERYYQKLGVHISTENAMLFNEQIDRSFREELFCHALINKKTEKKAVLKSIRDFLDVYDITEDDIKMDTLYRDFKRKKEDLKQNLHLISSHGTETELSVSVP